MDIITRKCPFCENEKIWLQKKTKQPQLVLEEDEQKYTFDYFAHHCLCLKCGNYFNFVLKEDVDKINSYEDNSVY